MRITLPINNFNPRSLTGSDWCVICVFNYILYFNPRSLTGSDFAFNLLAPPVAKFQSTLPYRERQTMETVNTTLHLFQSTLPYRERPATVYRSVFMWSDFNPRSLTGSDFRNTYSILPSQAFQSTLPYRERLGYR